MEAVNNPGGRRARARARCRSRGCSTSSRTISARIRRSSISGSRPAAKCACATATSSRAPAWSRTTTGEVVEVHCTYDPATRGGNAPDGRKVKSTIHWVSAAHAIDAEVRLYDNLFTNEDPGPGRRGPGLHREPESEFARSADGLQTGALAGGRRARCSRYQFERLGYFCVDPDSRAGQAGLQPHRGAARHLGQDRKAGQAVEMIILGIGGMLGDAAARILKDGELAAAVEESKLVAAPDPLGRARRAAGALHRHVPATGRREAGAGGRGRRGPPGSASRDFHLQAARAVSQQPHHRGGASPAHAASAYYPSPFEEATVLTLDRGGDFRCGSRWRGARRAASRSSTSSTLRIPSATSTGASPNCSVSGQRRRAQSAVALGRRATSASAICSSRF